MTHIHSSVVVGKRRTRKGAMVDVVECSSCHARLVDAQNDRWENIEVRKAWLQAAHLRNGYKDSIPFASVPSIPPSDPTKPRPYVDKEEMRDMMSETEYKNFLLESAKPDCPWTINKLTSWGDPSFVLVGP